MKFDDYILLAFTDGRRMRRRIVYHVRVLRAWGSMTIFLISPLVEIIID